MRRWTILAVLALAAGLGTAAHARYQEWGQWTAGQNISGGFWPEGADKLANRKERFGGHMLNSFDHFLYHGDTLALNAFLTDLGRVHGPKTVYLLAADEKAGLINPSVEGADWTMSLSANSHVGIFLSVTGPFKLRDLRIPANVPVESVGDVGPTAKALVEQHEKARAAGEKEKQ